MISLKFLRRPPDIVNLLLFTDRQFEKPWYSGTQADDYVKCRGRMIYRELANASPRWDAREYELQSKKRASGQDDERTMPNLFIYFSPSIHHLSFRLIDGTLASILWKLAHQQVKRTRERLGKKTWKSRTPIGWL